MAVFNLEMKFLLPWFLCLTVCSNAVSTSSARLLICPPTNEISPCSCYSLNSELGVSCSGGSVTQEIIERTLKVLKSYEAPGVPLRLRNFQVYETSISTLDLSPFTNVNMSKLVIYANSLLSTISGPAFGSIDNIAELKIHSNPKLADAGLANTLKYFAPSTLRSVLFYYGQFEGSPVIGEFLPGLDRLSQLHTLFINYSKVTRISGAQFFFNTHLQTLYLFHNQINEIGNNAFLFDTFSTDVPYLQIYLGYNNLTSNSFHVNHRLESISVRVILNVRDNQIDTIDSAIFEAFLLKTGNTLEVTNNPIICNGNVKWLKDRRDFYEPKVKNARCVNDPGQTIFNSTLVP